MYYEERLFNGLIQFRIAPDGDWYEMSKETLSRRLWKLQRELYEIKEKQGENQ
jgi:hypothetical protein